MGKNKSRLPPARPAESKTKPAPTTAAPANPAKATTVLPPPRAPHLFRKIDWWAFALTALLVFLGYYLTLSPNLTLEDSGELATASFYAGIPHPPGYPVWTLYTHLFTYLLPVSNIAWRVGVSSAFAGAVACGLLAMMVTRGSSMMIEGIAELKTLDRRWENALCLVAGVVAGVLMGFNGYFWSQAIIVEVYTLSVLSLMIVLICLLHFMYVPERRRYLYWALFVFGICFTNHQTLIVAAIGIELGISAVQPRLGRDLFLGNSLVYVGAILLKMNGMLTSFDNNPPLFVIFNLIGIASMIACGLLALHTKGLGTEWKPVLIMGLLWVAGAAFYFYMPIASMSTPPLNWGYPRTVEGFWHALQRGQYEKANPANIIQNPLRFVGQLWMYTEGAIEEFNVVYLAIGLVPFLFYRRMQKRERSWMIGLSGIYLGLALLLLILLNPSPDRQSKELNRVFFTSSHVMIAMWIGYGLTLIGALMATQYERWRRWILVGGVAAAAIQLYSLSKVLESTHDGVARVAAWTGIGVISAFVLVIAASRLRAPMGLALALFALMPAHSILSHWSDNEQRGHLFGYWFGHDMFTPPFNGADGKPLYPEMDRDTVLFGGTDPGRFNPTYMIYCESFIPPRCKKDTDPNFDRRDVYLITQNALADQTYLSYIRAHYNRSAQKDPPFFQEFFHAPFLAPLDDFFTALGARIEKRRRADGVFPPREILTPTVDDSAKAFQEYIGDAQRRVEHDRRFPNEPPQVRPGEDVHIDGGRVQVSGQVAVMNINGLLTKVIFDKNPDHSFYVEESFPLDWMYPYLTASGIIMKINRKPLPDMTEEILSRDHEFWTQYSGRLIGSWVTYDTPVKEICDFAERVFLRRDFTGFKGDRKFIRDDNGQKAFSKLRSAIAGVYAWRLGPQCPPEYRPKTAEAQLRLLKEADFAFRQALSFCPYSPEAVYRYVNLLVSVGRADDALLIARTCQKMDLENSSLQMLIDQVQRVRQGSQAEKSWRDNPNDFQLGFNFISQLLQQGQTNQALAVLSQILANPKGDANVALSVAKAFLQLQYVPGVEASLIKITTLLPDNPEAWYDLAAIKTVLQKTNDALRALEMALKYSAERLAKNPGATNLQMFIRQDGRFNPLRQLPEFQKLVPPP